MERQAGRNQTNRADRRGRASLACLLVGYPAEVGTMEADMDLYLVDNGMCLCADHLGASAKYTGRDISGQPIHRLTDDDRIVAAADGVVLRCERCSAIKRAS